MILIKQLLKGIIPPVVTPFDENEQMDEKKLREEVKYLLKTGVHGISFGGSTGEGALLSDEELARGITIVQEENTLSLPVLCGIIRNSLKDAVSAGLAAKKAGANVLMITPTFYHGTSEEGNYVYFEELASKVGLPIVIYNVVSDNPILPSAMKKIANIDNIIGIKQSIGGRGIHGLTDMIAECSDKVSIFGAQDDLMYISYELGAVGAISAIIALFPELCVQQWNAVQARNYDLAKEIHYRILPVWRTIEGRAFPGRIKAALNLLGRNVGKARKPILETTGVELENIKRALIQSSFL